MAAFLLLTWAGAQSRAFLPWSFGLRAILAAALLVIFHRHYTRIGWNGWGWGILIGVIGVVQWVGQEKLLVHFFPHYWRIPGAADPLNPWTDLSSAGAYAYLATRLIGMALVVPFMEELFWRDYLWRQIQAPNDFKLADIGEWDWQSVLIVTLAFATVHPMWLTAIIWGLMMAGLLLYTKALGPCIIAHAVTNLLLWVYVVHTGDWAML